MTATVHSERRARAGSIREARQAGRPARRRSTPAMRRGNAADRSSQCDQPRDAVRVAYSGGALFVSFQLPAVRFATRREPTTRAPAEAGPPRHLEIDNHARGVDTSGRRPHRGKCGLADAAHTMGALTTRRPTKPQRNYDSPATCKRSGSCPLVDGSLGAFLYLPL
jgi:hypothetical protein